MTDPVSPSATYLYTGGQGVDLGFGYNSLEGLITEQCLQASDAIQAAPGSKIDYYFRLIDDYHSLRTEMGISASLSFSGLGGGGGAEFNYQHNTSLSQYSVCLLGMVSVRQVPKTLKQWRVSKDTEGILRNQKNDAVFKTLGDQFVSALTLGGDLFLFLTFRAKNSSDYQSLHASLEAHVGPVGGSVAFNSKLEELAKSSDMEISIKASGSDSQFPTNVKEAIDFISSFPDQVKKAPYVTAISVESLAYALLGTGLPPDEVPRLGKQFAFIGKAALAYDQLNKAENSWISYQKAPLQINSPGITEQANAALSVIAKSKDLLETSVAKVRNDIYSPIPAIDFDSLITSLPAYPVVLADKPALAITVGATTNADTTTPTYSGHEGEWIRTNSDKGGYVNSFAIQFVSPTQDLSLEYQIYIQGSGLSDWFPSGYSAGSPINGIETNGIAIRLVGKARDKYSVSYRVSNRTVGDSNICKDGVYCGRTEKSIAMSGMFVSVDAKTALGAE